MINIPKMIYMSLVIRSLLLLILEHIINHINVFIRYIKSSIFEWFGENLKLYHAYVYYALKSYYCSTQEK